MSGLRGTANPSSKLTEDQVREIRRLWPVPCRISKKIWRQPHRHSQHRQWPQMAVVG
jgi:hypothetical protein